MTALPLEASNTEIWQSPLDGSLGARSARGGSPRPTEGAPLRCLCRVAGGASRGGCLDGQRLVLLVGFFSVFKVFVMKLWVGILLVYEGQTLERTLKLNGYFDEEVLRDRGRRHPMITVVKIIFLFDGEHLILLLCPSGLRSSTQARIS